MFRLAPHLDGAIWETIAALEIHSLAVPWLPNTIIPVVVLEVPTASFSLKPSLKTSLWLYPSWLLAYVHCLDGFMLLHAYYQLALLYYPYYTVADSLFIIAYLLGFFCFIIIIEFTCHSIFWPLLRYFWSYLSRVSLAYYGSYILFSLTIALS